LDNTTGESLSRRRFVMKVIVKFSVREELKALPLLLRHSPGMVLPERTYVIAEEAAAVLLDAGIRFTVVSKEARASGLKGEILGQRI